MQRVKWVLYMTVEHLCNRNIVETLCTYVHVWIWWVVSHRPLRLSPFFLLFLFRWDRTDLPRSRIPAPAPICCWAVFSMSVSVIALFSSRICLVFCDFYVFIYILCHLASFYCVNIISFGFSNVFIVADSNVFSSTSESFQRLFLLPSFLPVSG